VRTLALAALVAVLAAGSVDEGNRRYAAGDYAGAAEAYARAVAEGDTSPLVRYNLGTALLRLERYDEALPHLEAAAHEGAPPPVRVRGYYNGGNADLQPAFDGAVPDEARRERLERAVRHYRDALRLDPGDADAKWNLELAGRLLDERPPPADGGGEGEGEDDGAGADGTDGPAPGAPSPAPRDAEDGDAPVTRERAERLLDEAQEREMEVQRRQLRREQRSIRGVRDW
jgi:tetratricopeptide (TPR) repeat protein